MTGPAPYCRVGSRLLPLVAALLIAVLDQVMRARPWPVPVVGLLDEPAHLTTTWLALCALAPRSTPSSLYRAALVAAVTIDIDHVPLYLTGGRFAVDGGRPPTHSLMLVGILGVAAALRAMRWWLLGVAAGVLLHLVRDVATGPGVPLLWPFSDANIQLPYCFYLTVVVILALWACLRGTVRLRCDGWSAKLLRRILRGRSAVSSQMSPRT